MFLIFCLTSAYFVCISYGLLCGEDDPGLSNDPITTNWSCQSDNLELQNLQYFPKTVQTAPYQNVCFH